MTIQNNVAFKPDRYNVTMAAIDFDGTTESYGSLPSGAYFGKEFSFSFWVFVKANVPMQKVFDFGDGFKINNIFASFKQNTLKSRFIAYQQDQSICLDILSDKEVNLNEWVHLAVTYENQNATMYLNGELVANGQANHADCCTWNTQNNYIGRSQSIMSQIMISSLKIFKRSLNVDEILLHQSPLELVELNP